MSHDSFDIVTLQIEVSQFRYDKGENKEIYILQSMECFQLNAVN